jgi:TPP-dependent indolepyruvate ferredoxin oxidoreductase alpha subunit
MLCVSQFGCPAIIPDPANKIQIVADRCPGAILCGVCLEICPENAILERRSENE